MVVPARSLPLLALAALLVLSGPAQAVYPPPIKDDGKFFSSEALDKANKKIRAIYEKYKRDVVIETYMEIPAAIEKKYADEDRKELFRHWARERTHNLGLHGVYILVCKKPGHLQFEVDPDTMKSALPVKERDRASNKMLASFKEREYDAGLLAALEIIETAFKTSGK